MENLMKNIEEQEKPIGLQTNLIGSKETELIINETLEFVSNAVGGSLGPFGHNTIIQDPYMDHSITKDGYTILKNLILYEKGNRGIFDNLIKISRKLVRTVGDGSTSAIIIAKKFFELLTEFKRDNKLNVNVIKYVLNNIQKSLERRIVEGRIEISTDPNDLEESLSVISKIASVSTNNDSNMGELIKSLFEKIGVDGKASVELSDTEETYISTVDGFQVDGGYFSDIFVNEPDTNEVIFENPRIFMVSGRLMPSDITVLVQLLNDLVIVNMQSKRAPIPFVVMTSGIDKDALDLFLINKKNMPMMPVAVIEIPSGTSLNKNKFNDLAAFTNSYVYNKYSGENINFLDGDRLGKAQKIVISKTQTTVYQDPSTLNNDTMRSIIGELVRDITEAEKYEGTINNSKEIWQLTTRLNALTGKLGVIHVGGETELEKKNTRFLVEDAILAVRSAVKYGYTVGGNLTIPIIISKYKEEILKEIKLKEISLDESIYSELVDIVMNSFKHSYDRVLDNYYNDEPNNKFLSQESMDICNKCVSSEMIFNLKSMTYESIDSTSIINSVDTDIQILKSVLSIITLLVTSNQMLKTA